MAFQIKLINEQKRNPQSGLYTTDGMKAGSNHGAVRKQDIQDFRSRVMGWYVMAHVDVPDNFTEDHPERKELSIKYKSDTVTNDLTDCDLQIKNQGLLKKSANPWFLYLWQRLFTEWVNAGFFPIHVNRASCPKRFFG